MAEHRILPRAPTSNTKILNATENDGLNMLNKLWGTSFRYKIEQLETSFAAASTPFHAEIKRVEEAAAAFQKEVEAGNATWEQTTDDGDHYDYGADLAERRDDALDALLTLRKAFTFLIYHQRERLAQHWTKPGKSPNHKDLVKAAKAAGVSLDEPGLEMLRLLVNTLKHNSKNWREQLYKDHPDLFDAAFDPSGNSPITGRPYTVINWADRILLTDTNIVVPP